MRTFLRLSVLFALAAASASAQWTQTAGPAGGTINAIDVSGATAWAATEEGVYRSSDGGASWRKGGLAEFRITTLAAKGDVVLAGGEKTTIHRSTDGGATWEAITVTPMSDEVAITALLAHGPYFFAGARDYSGRTAGGLFRSSDDGASWTLLDPNGGEIWSITSLTANDTYVFAAGGFGVVRSSDGGFTWGFGGIMEPIETIEANGPILVAANQQRFTHSDDNGTAWSRISELPDHAWVYDFVFAGSDVLAATSNGVYRSTSPGSAWTSSSVGLNNTDVPVLARGGGAIWAGTKYGGVNRSTDNGATWRIASNGIVKSHVGATFVDGTNLWAGTMGGLHLTTDRGSSWSYANLPNKVGSIVRKGNWLLAATVDSGIFRSTDGFTWSASSSGLVENARYTYALMVDGDRILAGTADGIWSSTDDGASWTRTDAVPVIGSSVSDFAKDPAGIIYASYAGYIFNADNGGVVFSTDQGVAWDTLGANGTPVAALAVDNRYLWAGISGRLSFGLLRYDRRTAQWENIPFAGQAAVENAQSLLLHDGTIYVGGNMGIYASPSDRDEWRTFSDGLPSLPQVTALDVDGSTLYAGTYGRGLWHRSAASSVYDCRLFGEPGPALAAHPNPSAGATTIRYRLERAGAVTVELHDPLGRRVATLVDGEQAAGDHAVGFDGGSLPNGAYRLRIRSADGVTSSEMLIVR